MVGFSKENLIAILNDLAPNMNNISISYVDLFIKNLLELIDKVKDDFQKAEFDFEALGFKKEKYLSRVKGCEESCPCCGRLCDAEHYKIHTEIGSPTNKHKCNRGHQFRGMNGFKYEHSNKPSFKICESMKENEMIRDLRSGNTVKWSEYKLKYPKWNFDSDSTQSVYDWTNKCTYIWSFIGERICSKYGMTYTPLAIDELPSSDANLNPIHFILILDDSGSMEADDKWAQLVQSVRDFLHIRSNLGGSEKELVSILVFSVHATIEIANSQIYPELVDQLREPSFGPGTNYSAALEKCIHTIRELNSSTHKYAIVFMSDGQAEYPTNEIEIIKANYMNAITNFWCIGYGIESEFGVLKKMLFKLNGDENNFLNPQDANQLNKAYQRINVEVPPQI